MGVVSPLGSDLETFWNNLSSGVSGVGPVTRFDASQLSTRIAAEVKDFEPTEYMDRKDARRMGRFTQFAVAASRLAVEHAKLDIQAYGPERVGVWIGSGIGGLEVLEENSLTLLQRGPGRISPFFVPMMIPDMASGQVSILLGAKGPNSCTVTACASGANSIGDAFRVIQNGQADVMIAGGTEAAVTLLGMAGFCSARAMTTRNDEPTRASRPFDANRDGFVLGEGAGVLILEELESAKRRGATIYGEVVGYGMTGDAYHMTAPAPEGEGAARAMAMALADAGMAPEEIDYINAHGTSTLYNDVNETTAIRRVFGDHAEKLAISSTKSMMGHLLGAAGAVEAIACLLTMQHSLIPPTINLEQPGEGCDLDYVPNVARPATVNACMSNSFGFGGHNAVLVFRRYEAEE